MPVLRDSDRGRAARACAGASQLRAGGQRAGREPHRRPPCPCLPGDAAAVPARRPQGLDRVDGRDPREGRCPGGCQRVHGAGPGAAEVRAGRARGRDPGPDGRRDAVRAPGLHRLPDAHAHRGPVRARYRRRRRPPRLPGNHRPRRLRRLQPPHRRAARLVRSSPAPGPAGPVRLRAGKAGPGLEDGSWTTWSPATGNSPPPGSPRASTAAPRPRATPAASPAGSSPSRT